jgi:endonuclease YncB( thermonuclease family)
MILGGLAAIVAFCFTVIERFPEHLGRLPALTAVRTVEGAVTHVRDGDTIEVAGTPIRFGSLDCAERDTMEGWAATARMRELVSDQNLTLSCALNGRTSHDRKIGSCRLPEGQDLAAIMTREGYCGRFW